NVQLLGATAANIVTLGANVIYCSNVVGLPPAANLADISGNSISYSSANVTSLGAGTLFCGNIVGVPIVANTTDLKGNSLLYAAANVGTLALYGNSPYISIKGTTDPGDYLVKQYGSIGDRYGIGLYNGGMTRTFTSATYPFGQVALSLASTDSTAASATTFQDILTASKGNVIAYRPFFATSATISGNLSLSNTTTLSLGYDVAGKEVNAGKIGYGTFSNYNSLDVVGAGLSNGQRRVQVYDQLIVNSAGPGAGNLYASTGQFSANVNAVNGQYTGVLAVGSAIADTSIGSACSIVNRVSNASYVLAPQPVAISQTTGSQTQSYFNMDFNYPSQPGIYPGGRLVVNDSNFSTDWRFQSKIPGAATNTTLERLTIASSGNVGINQAFPQATLDVNGPARVGGNLAVNAPISLSNTNTLSLGYDVAGKETNAGKIGYGTFSGTSLDVVGAGLSSGQRRVQVYDQLIVNSANPGAGNVYAVTGQFSANVNAAAASFTNAITAANASISGQQSFLQSSGQNCNLFIGNTLSTNQSGFLTYNSQYAPGNAGAVGIGVFGVSGGLTVAPSGSVGINQAAPSSAYALDVGGQMRVSSTLSVPAAPTSGLALDVAGPSRFTASSWTQG
ncbi:MAG: hypothetical protein ACOYBT_10400, partial [Polynucleobacter sp.]